MLILHEARSNKTETVQVNRSKTGKTADLVGNKSSDR